MMSPSEIRETRSGGRLTRCAGSLLSLLIILRRSRDLDSFSDLKRTVDRLFHDFRSRARDEEISPDDIADASYALAASFDEVVLSATWEGKDDWKRDNLAKQYCNDEFVGDGFYDKLAEIRRAPEPRRAVLEIFYYCLTSSFQGRMIESPQQREDLIDELSREVGTQLKVLSPHGLPVPEGGKLQPIKRFPWPVVVIVSLLVPFIIYMLSMGVLNKHARSIADTLEGL